MEIAAVAPSSDTPVVLTCADGVQSTLASAALQELGYRNMVVLEGGMAAWRQAGLSVETGLVNPAVAVNDVTRAGTERSEAEMRHYLAWEEELGKKYERPV